MYAGIEIYVPEIFDLEHNHVIAKAFLSDDDEHYKEIVKLISETFDPMHLTIKVDLHPVYDMEKFMRRLEEIDVRAQERGVLVTLVIACTCAEVCRSNMQKLIYSVRWKSRWGVT